MAYFSGLDVDRVEDGKTYLKGKVKGRESGRNYCLYYGYNNNLPNNSLNYTFLSGSTLDYDLKDHGSYVPGDALASHEITCYMVGANCEDQWNEQDSEYVTVPEEEPDGVLCIHANDADTSAAIDNAYVYVDDVYKGRTDLTTWLLLTVDPGSHTITLTKTGYDDKSITVSVDAGETVYEYVSMDPEVTDGVIWIRAKDADTDAYLDYAYVYVDDVYKGSTDVTTWLLLTVDPGSHTIKLTKTGYDDKSITVSVDAGETVYEYVSMDPEVTTGTVEVRAIVNGGTEEITGANIYQRYYGAVTAQDVDTGYTTPHTFTLDAGTYYFFTEKEHFTHSPVQSVTLGAGDSKTVTCEMVPAGLQCDIDLLTTLEDGATIPDMFALPTPNNLIPTFGFSMPFNIGDFTYYGLGWAVLNEPAPHIVTSALADSIVVKVNDIEVTPIIGDPSVNNDIGFDLFGIIEGLITDGSIATDITQLTIEITYATRLWFETGNHTNNSVLYTETKTILIPIAALGFCSLISNMSGPAEIPITLPALPALPPVIGSTVLDIDLAATCENLTAPLSVPIELFLFGSDTPAISTNVSPGTTYTPDISSHILPYITNMITAGTTLPAAISVILRCPEGYTPSGFSDTPSDFPISIDILLPEPGDIFCDVDLTAVQPSGIAVSQPALGLPALNITTLPITGVMGIICKEDGVSIPTPTGIAPPDIDLYVMDSFVTTLSVDSAGNFTHDIISQINASTLISQNITNIEVELWYPSVVWIEGITTAEDVTIIRKSISIPVSLPDVPDVPGSLLCDISVSADVPSTIPINIPTPGATPVPGVTSIPVTALFTSWCTGDGDEPADLLTFIAANVYINNGLFDTVTPNAQGSIEFDLSTNTGWLSSINLGDTSIELKIIFPEQLRCSTPTPIGTKTYTTPIGINVTETPDEPNVGCVITDFDRFTCPDLSKIDLFKCDEEGNKVWISPPLSCPDIPDEGCGLLPSDYFNCSDGSVIPLYECDEEGNKVLISPPLSCPDIPEPPCEILDEDYFTCPDGTVIPLFKCVDGFKVLAGVPCPDPVCEITDADMYTCPDGSVIPLSKCVNGVKVPTAEMCPPVVDIREKTVYVTTPMVTRSGKRVSIVAFVRCGTEKSSGEEATITANGGIITTTHTRNGKVTASWIPIDTGLYTICVDVPASSLCSEGASSCTYIRVVSELSPPEIEAAEEEFEKAKDRIGEIMERI